MRPPLRLFILPLVLALSLVAIPASADDSPSSSLVLGDVRLDADGVHLEGSLGTEAWYHSGYEWPVTSNAVEQTLNSKIAGHLVADFGASDERIYFLLNLGGTSHFLPRPPVA